MTETPILSVRDLKKHYPITEGILSREVGRVKAVDGISFDLYPGESLGIVGESGCGKSTAATSIIRLEEPTSGEIIFNSSKRRGATRNADGTHPNDVAEFDDEELTQFRREAQMMFQDPASSFDPRMTVGDSVAEMLMVHGMDDKHQRRAIVEDLLDRVGLSADDYDRYPHELSGGQKQRVGLARALVLNPELLVADEPVSALDVSIQAEILALIEELQEEYNLSLLFISHDMSVIQQICDRVAVMYLGEIVEIGDVETIFADPQHPYTEALLSSIPTPDPRSDRESITLRGTVPSPENPPSGCRFHTRCHRVIQPDGVDIDQSNWRGLLTLRDQVVADEIDLEKMGQNIAGTDGDADTADPAEVKTRLRTEFGIDETIGDHEVDETLECALDLLVSEEITEATEVLTSSFTTPCEQTKPEFTDHGGGHKSSCLRHTQRQSVQRPTQD